MAKHLTSMYFAVELTNIISAIMRFHSLKMDEINQILDELWKKTYTGTDVDTILIRSDNENTRGNRSYNYRVMIFLRT